MQWWEDASFEKEKMCRIQMYIKEGKKFILVFSLIPLFAIVKTSMKLPLLFFFFLLYFVHVPWKRYHPTLSHIFTQIIIFKKSSNLTQNKAIKKFMSAIYIIYLYISLPPLSSSKPKQKNDEIKNSLELPIYIIQFNDSYVSLWNLNFGSIFSLFTHTHSTLLPAISNIQTICWESTFSFFVLLKEW